MIFLCGIPSGFSNEVCCEIHGRFLGGFSCGISGWINVRTPFGIYVRIPGGITCGFRFEIYSSSTTLALKVWKRFFGNT